MSVIEPHIELKNGDCLEVMKSIANKSVDMILCDLPYGITAIEWDKPIPFIPMWEQYERIIKDNGVIVLFSAQPFTTDLIVSNRKLFRYEIIWKKSQPQGFLNANKCPLRNHENILVFYKKLPTYNPIKSKIQTENFGRVRKVNAMRSQQYREMDRTTYTETGKRYPTDVIEFSNWNGGGFGNTDREVTKHPTQKPIDLCEYLISTYSNPGDVVLDNCMGSGSVGIACFNLNRNFIGIEISPEYFALAETRIKNTMMQLRLFGLQDTPENPNYQPSVIVPLNTKESELLQICKEDNENQ